MRIDITRMAPSGLEQTRYTFDFKVGGGPGPVVAFRPLAVVDEARKTRRHKWALAQGGRNFDRTTGRWNAEPGCAPTLADLSIPEDVVKQARETALSAVLHAPLTVT